MIEVVCLHIKVIVITQYINNMIFNIILIVLAFILILGIIRVCFDRPESFLDFILEVLWLDILFDLFSDDSNDW